MFVFAGDALLALKESIADPGYSRVGTWKPSGGRVKHGEIAITVGITKLSEATAAAVLQFFASLLSEPSRLLMILSKECLCIRKL